MKNFITQLVIAALLVTSMAPMARADDNPDTRTAVEVRPENYLQSCNGILEANSDDYEKLFIEGATNENQMLQILYDGGLILSKLFVSAFLVTLGQKFKSTSAALDIEKNYKKKIKAHRAEYKNLGNQLELLGRASNDELNQFVWSLLENEVALSSAKTQSNGQPLPDAAEAEVRYNQVNRLVKALQSASNRALVENSLRDVVSQALLSFAREILLRLAQYQTTLFYDGPAEKLLIFAAVSSFFAAAWGGGELANHLLSTNFWNNYPDLGYAIVTASGFVSAIPAPVATVFAALSPLHFRADGLNKRANSVERVVYVIPKGSSEERFEISDLLKANLDELKENPYVVPLAKACEGNTCDLTPMQIASVGDLDLLELERLFSSLRDSFGGKFSPLNKDTLRDALTTVIQNPNDYRAQMNLRRRLSDYRKAALMVADERKQILDQVLNKTKVLKDNFALLRRRPFTEVRSNDEEVARGILLLSKINSDLVRLDGISLDVEKFERSIDRVKSVADSIEGWLNSLPDSEHGWSEAANNILQQYNQMEAAR